MSGRARGRARGKPRGGGPAPPPRRPGEEEPPIREEPIGPGVSRGRGRGGAAPSEEAPVAGSGRASLRGTTRGERKPGAPAAPPPTAEMAALSVGTGDARDVGNKRTRWVELNTRPAHASDKKGTSGAQVSLFTNHFRLESLGRQFILYQYWVSFKPEVDSKRVRIAIVKSNPDIIGPVSAFDGMVLFIPRKLDDTTVFTSTTTFNNSPVEVTIKFTNELTQGDATSLQVLNVFLRRALFTIGMQQIGRDYFNPNAKISIPQHKMEVWPGFTTSILQYESDVLLGVDLKYKVLRNTTVLDMMVNIHSRSQSNFNEECIKALVGEIVLTRYNNKTYRVDDIDFKKNPQSRFETRDGSLSYVEYYRKAYNKNITELGQPLLYSRPKEKDKRGGRDNPIYLVPELCVLTGISDQMRADFNVMKDMAIHTRVGPQQRYDTLSTFIKQLSDNADVNTEMSNWGLKFARELVRVSGRALPPELLLQKTCRFSYDARTADWSREMRGKQLISAVNLENWGVLFTTNDTAKANDLIKTMQKVGPPMGINLREPLKYRVGEDRLDAFRRSLEAAIKPQVQLIMCVVPSNRKDRYDTIKKFCCLAHPVPSQVVVSRTLNKAQMLMSVATKIVLQINCKLGGEGWATEIPLKNMMVIGIDTFHEKKSQSFGGFVASLNPSLTRYYSRCVAQQRGQELHHAIVPCFAACLKKYNEINGTLPDRIVIYRDGVGDGQLPVVVEHELKQFRNTFEEVKPGYLPKLAFIIVKKRISARFFMSAERSLSNPPPGTIIDSVVTKPEWYDFFLVSQSVRQGTVSPTHYNVIHDTTGLKPDHIQRLTYKLTHLYYNWPGTIRVPAPCQYAHKLAYLVGQSIHEEPALQLADRLYYL